jgi:uncharacterized protein
MVPLLRQDWCDVSFVHWRFESDELAPQIPDGLELDTFDGQGWVSLTPFRVRAQRPAWPGTPRWWEYAETNLRTYVRGSDGVAALWFFSIDVSSLVTTATARLIGAPYHWARMSITTAGDIVTYRSDRRTAAQCRTNVVIERRGQPVDDRLATWLTDRRRGWTRLPTGQLIALDVAHEPWPLHTGRLIRLDQSLTDASGLGEPRVAPIVHTATGVHATLGASHARFSRAR